MPAYSFKIPSQLQLQGSSYTFSYKFLKAINVKKKSVVCIHFTSGKKLAIPDFYKMLPNLYTSQHTV